MGNHQAVRQSLNHRPSSCSWVPVQLQTLVRSWLRFSPIGTGTWPLAASGQLPQASLHWEAKDTKIA